MRVVSPGKGIKPTSTDVIGHVELIVEESKDSNSMSIARDRNDVTDSDKPTATVHQILQKILRYYPYKISYD